MLKSPELRQAKATVRRLEAGERKARKAEAQKSAKVEIASIMENRKHPRERDNGFLYYLRRQLCEARHLGGRSGPPDPAHIRFNDGPARLNPGGGRKNHDFHCNPLCRARHDEQHSGSERAFWERLGKDAYETAAGHYASYRGTDHG